MADKLFIKIDDEDLETSALVGVHNVLKACQLKPHEQRRVLLYLVERAAAEAVKDKPAEMAFGGAQRNFTIIHPVMGQGLSVLGQAEPGP